MIELILHEPLTDESHASESELSGVRSKKPVEKDLALVTLAAVLLCFEMAPAENNLAALLLVCVPALWFSIKLDLDIRGRNCDRTVERSPALEVLDELDALLLRDLCWLPRTSVYAVGASAKKSENVQRKRYA
jgi:hypothetical protein